MKGIWSGRKHNPNGHSNRWEYDTCRDDILHHQASEMITLVPVAEKHISALHSMMNDVSVRSAWSDTGKPLPEKTLAEVGEWQREWIGCAYILIDDGGFIIGFATIDDHDGPNWQADIFA